MPCGACLRIKTLECLVERLNHTMPVPENKAVETLTLLEVFKEDCQEQRMWGCWLHLTKTRRTDRCLHITLQVEIWEKGREILQEKRLIASDEWTFSYFPTRQNQPVCNLEPVYCNNPL